MEPLLDRIAENPTNVVAPMIAGIHDDTFRFEPHNASKAIPYGIFKWDLSFDWTWLRRKKAESPGQKIVAPVRWVSN